MSSDTATCDRRVCSNVGRVGEATRIVLCLYLFACTMIGAEATDSCYNGHYSVSKPPFGKCTGFRPCEPGHYCINGKKAPCPAGTYGNRAELNSSSCTGACPAGYFCPTNTIDFGTFPCGDASRYCPEGSTSPQLVPSGYFSVYFPGSSTLPVTDSPHTHSAIVLCSPGHYCADGIQTPCPGGRYGASSGLFSAACSGECPAGFYCPVGSILPFSNPCGDHSTRFCPAGAERPHPVGEGYYATDLVRDMGGGFSSQSKCPLGSFCIDGQRRLCPAGRYGAITQEVDPMCSGVCRAGYYCPQGSILSSPVQCDQTFHFCPTGSMEPVPVSVGYYSIGSDRNISVTTLVTFDMNGNIDPGTTRTGQHICMKGSYCIRGVHKLCPAGRYGATEGLSSADCSGPCSAGHFCPEGSVSATEFQCGGADLFCPVASPSPQWAHEGYYTVFFDEEDYGNALTRASERRCEPGYYCQQGERRLCTAGYFGSTFGLTAATCSGPCNPGFYCPEGSSSEEEVMCGDPDRYCPEGSPRPIYVPLGYYTTGGNTSTRFAQEMAPIGSFAVNGLVYPCPAGFFGATKGLFTKTCTGPCSVPGFYCPTGSISPFMRYCGAENVFCPAGTPAPIRVQAGFYTGDYVYEACPPGMWRNWTYPREDFLHLPQSAVITHHTLPECQLCPLGTYKTVASDDLAACLSCDVNTSISSASRVVCDCAVVYRSGLSGYFNASTGSCPPVALDLFYLFDKAEYASNISLTRSQEFPCEPGHFCVEGLRYHCPPGRYGDLYQETRPACAGPCAPGYFCLRASTSPLARPCGGADWICPGETFDPVRVPAGFYSNEDVREDLRSKMFVCPQGFYCPGDGRRYPCPPGTYTDEKGTVSSTCKAPCDRGHYCIEGSFDRRQFVCGNSSVYCVTGSSRPTPATGGFYTISTGSDAGEVRFWNTDNTTQSAELPCEPGYYCVEGVKFPCPPGYFGWRYGMTSSTCGGKCAPGYYCPSYLRPQPGAAAFTVWPGKPHTVANELECGDVNYICPRGSAYPTRVSGGHYSIGGNADNHTRFDQVICPRGSYCVNSIAILCPPGRYGSTQGLTVSQCTSGCPAGFYCPSGTADPKPCPENTYSTGRAPVCSPCGGSRTTPMPCHDDNTCCLRG